MDLNAIVVFVKVVEAGSFVGAARTADIPKSTVARRIDELERFLGVRLLQRSTRKSELTDAGRSFYDRCRQIVADIDDATASVSSHQHEPRGKLRCSASVLLGESYLGRWVVEYMQKYPEVEVDLFLAARKVDLLADGFDLVIRTGRLEPSSHIIRKLAPSPHYICASQAYIDAHGAPTAAEDVRQHECIVFSPERVTQPWKLENDSGDSISIAVASKLIVNSFPVALDACRAGLGLAELPAIVCSEALRSGELIRLLPEWYDASRWLHALYPSRQHLSATLRTFLDFMTEKLRPPPWLDGEASQASHR